MLVFFGQGSGIKTHIISIQLWQTFYLRVVLNMEYSAVMK